MNVDGLSVETEIMQSRLAVQVLKERNIVARRRMKKVSCMTYCICIVLMQLLYEDHEHW